MSPNQLPTQDKSEVLKSAELAAGFNAECRDVFECGVWKPIKDEKPEATFLRVTLPLGNGLRLDIHKQVIIPENSPLPGEEDYFLIVRKVGNQVLHGSVTHYMLGVTPRSIEAHAKDGHGDDGKFKKVGLNTTHRRFMTELLGTLQQTVENKKEKVATDKAAAERIAKYKKARGNRTNSYIDGLDMDDIDMSID